MRREITPLTMKCDSAGCSVDPLSGSIRIGSVRTKNESLELAVTFSGFPEGAHVELRGQTHAPKALVDTTVGVDFLPLLADTPLKEQPHGFLRLPSLGTLRVTLADGRSAQAEALPISQSRDALYTQLLAFVGKPLVFGAAETNPAHKSVLVLAPTRAGDVVLGGAERFAELTHLATYTLEENGSSRTCSYKSESGERSAQTFAGFTGTVRIYDRKTGTRSAELRIGSSGQCPKEIDVNQNARRADFGSFEQTEREQTARRAIAKHLGLSVP